MSKERLTEEGKQRYHNLFALVVQERHCDVVNSLWSRLMDLPLSEDSADIALKLILDIGRCLHTVNGLTDWHPVMRLPNASAFERHKFVCLFCSELLRVCSPSSGVMGTPVVCS